MSLKKSIKKLLSDPAEMRIDEVANILIRLGFQLDRIKGSHYTFTRPGTDKITVPRHGNKVSKVYLKQIKNDFIIELLLL